MVIKEARPDQFNWRDPLQWRDNLPKEIRNHQKIDSNRIASVNRGHRNLVRHRGYRLMMRQRRFRLFLDYYEGGNLSSATRHHFAKRTHPRDGRLPAYWIGTALTGHFHREGDPLRLPPAIIPEPFIWEVFRSLIGACQILSSGQAGDVDSLPGWQPITHLDIRFANILLQPRTGGQVLIGYPSSQMLY
jgi:hypothetical protein